MDRATPRTRTFRHKVAQRRGRHALLIGTLALSAALTSTLAVGGLAGVDVAAAAAAKAQSFIDLMSQRSPGARTEAHLTKVKHKHSKVLAEREQPEAVSPAIAQPLAEALLAPTPDTLVLPDIAPILAQAASPAPAFFAPPVGGGIFAAGGGGGLGGGGTGGGGTPGAPPGQPSGPPAETPAVPEPTSWAMMIAGFGLSGFMLRRRRPSERRALPAKP